MSKKDTRNGIIYKATSRTSSKSYIGLTTQTLETRKQKHKSDAKRMSNLHFHNALNKYGFDDFEWEILFNDGITHQELCQFEIYFIGKYDTFNNGYNLTKGGEISPILYLTVEEKNDLYKKRTETRQKTIDPETGLNICEIVGYKSAETLRSQIDESGKNGLQKRSEKGKETKLNFSQEKKDIINMKMSDTRSKWSAEYRQSVYKKMSRNGIIHGHSKKFLLISPNGQKIGCYGTLEKKCNKYNISETSLRHNINKGPISTKPKSKVSQTQKWENTQGWEIIEIKD